MSKNSSCPPQALRSIPTSRLTLFSGCKTQKALAQLGGRIALHLLPPYCPKANRIERMWMDLHANVTCNHRCPTMARLMVRVHAYLTARTTQRTASPCLRRADLKHVA